MLARLVLVWTGSGEWCGMADVAPDADRRWKSLGHDTFAVGPLDGGASKRAKCRYSMTKCAKFPGRGKRAKFPSRANLYYPPRVKPLTGRPVPPVVDYVSLTPFPPRESFPSAPPRARTPVQPLRGNPLESGDDPHRF